MQEPTSKTPDETLPSPSGKRYTIIMFEQGDFDPEPLYAACREAWNAGSRKKVLEVNFILPDGAEPIAGTYMEVPMLALKEGMFGCWIKGVRQ